MGQKIQIELDEETWKLLLLNEPCLKYGVTIPLFQILNDKHPPEYYPLLGVGAGLLVVNTVMSVMEMRKHYVFCRGATFTMGMRTTAILAAYWLFAFTSWLGMISLRSSRFLYFIAVTFEAFCIWALFENIRSHLKSRGFFKTPKILKLRVGLCYYIPFLPDVKTSPFVTVMFRRAIYQMIFFQVVVECMRVVLVAECSYSPIAPTKYIGDGIVFLSFGFAMWVLLVIYRAGYDELQPFHYGYKFLYFKLMILISKFVAAILVLVANGGSIPDYVAADKTVILKGRQRVGIWMNFVTIFASTILFHYSKRLYQLSDYAHLHKRRESTDDTNTDHKNEADEVELVDEDRMVNNGVAENSTDVQTVGIPPSVTPSPTNDVAVREHV